MENISVYNFMTKSSWDGRMYPFKISLIYVRNKINVEIRMESSSGIHKDRILLQNFNYNVKQESTQLKLIDNKGSYWGGFSLEDKEKLDLFIENKNLIKRGKFSISDFIDFKKKQEIDEKNSVKKKLNTLLYEEFDKDNNGELDILEGDNLLIDLLEKNQSQITEFDHKLVQNIIRLNKFLNSKKKNLINIFNLLKTVEKNRDLEEVLSVLRQGIDNYQYLLIHSLNMVISLKEKQMINYYELYETFDGLGVFNSNWENKVSKKLSSIDSKLSDVINSIKEVVISIKKMEDSITTSLDELTYTTKTSFDQLNTSLTSELKSIRSGVQWNNLLTGIQVYQTYKINKNTKGLN